jgi:hypothetical protein
MRSVARRVNLQLAARLASAHGSAVGEAFLQEGIEDIAFISLRYPNDVLAKFTHPGSIRRKSVKSRSSAPGK